MSGTLAKNGTTLTLNGGSSGITVSGQIVGGNPNSDLIITGGTTTVTNNNTYNGATVVTSTGTLNVADNGSLSATTGVTVNSGGTLLLSNPGATANTDRIFNSATVSLAGATALRSTNSAKEGIATVTGGGGTSAVGLGALTLTASSTIDFDSASNGNLLVFASGFTPGGFTVTVTNWTNANFDGSLNSGLSADDRLVFNQNMSGFLSSFDFGFGPGVNVSQIALDSGFFEIGGITPVPEPSAVATVMGLLGLIGWRERRKVRTARQDERRAALAVA